MKNLVSRSIANILTIEMSILAISLCFISIVIYPKFFLIIQMASLPDCSDLIICPRLVYLSSALLVNGSYITEIAADFMSI